MAPPADDRPPTRTQRLLAWAAGLALRGVAALPVGLAYALADLVTPLVVLFTLQHERKVRHKGRGLFRNQRIAFREGLTPERSRRLLWGWARHMARLGVDFARIRTLDAKAVRACVDLRGLERVRELQAQGKGVICASGHMGVWELCGHVAAVSGFATNAVGRPPRNPALAEALNAHRSLGGQQILTKWGVLWPIVKALKRGELVGIAADENDRLNPLFVPFLGTLAATNTTPALIQRKTGAPIAVVSVHRTGRGRYRFHVWDVIENPRSKERDPELGSITRRINAALTRAILAYPEQWLWGSRRFHTRPPGEVLGPDGLPPIAEPVPPEGDYPPGYDAAPGEAHGAVSYS